MPVLNTTDVIEDSWVTVEDGAPIPASTPVILSWERIAAEGDAVLAGNAPRGVVISSDFDVAKLLPLISRLGLIVVRPNNFKDGRMFSVGRLLRQRYGFNGDLRVVGEFIPDQVPFLVRCGFTSFDVAPTFDIPATQRLLKNFAFNYQSGVTDRNIFAMRHGKPERLAGNA